MSKLLFTLSLSITAFTAFMLFKETVPDNIQSISLLILLLLINTALFYLHFRPQVLNYPIAINNENRETMFRKVKVLLSSVSLFISMLFMALIFTKIERIDFTVPIQALAAYIVLLSILPIFVIWHFRK